MVSKFHQGIRYFESEDSQNILSFVLQQTIYQWYQTLSPVGLCHN